MWLGIANGVLARGQDLFPLALRYLLAGLAANFVSGYATELITRRVEKKQGIRLDRKVDLWTEREGEASAESANSDAAAPAKTAQSAGAVAASSSVPEEGSDSVDSRTGYHTITITRGDGGYGGPLTITPTEERHIVLYMTGGGLEPEPLARIVELSGMEPVNGNQETCPDEEVALAIIDCGGTLRCGIYPGKGIPTVNILATGKSGPLAKYMTEDMYVSAVTSECVSAVAEDVVRADVVEEEDVSVPEEIQVAEASETKKSVEPDKTFNTSLNKLLESVLTISKVISLNDSAFHGICGAFHWYLQRLRIDTVSGGIDSADGRKPSRSSGIRNYLFHSRPECDPRSGCCGGTNVFHSYRRIDRCRQYTGLHGTSCFVCHQLSMRV